MESGRVTTPFGRRRMTLGMLASQYASNEIQPDRSVNKWKLFRAICEARPLLGITDRALSVLDALLTFYPQDDLCQANGLVIFPSNAQLSVRAHGMTPATLRRHLAVLVDAGLLIRKDSPNGKRYARRGRDGDIEQAFGFSIAPLLTRADEIDALAAQLVAERTLLRVTREQLTLCRRDIAKLIDAASSEDAPGDWTAMHMRFRAIVLDIPRTATGEQLTRLLAEMEMLRTEILNTLESQLKAKNPSAIESQNERHKQNSNPDSISKFEPANAQAPAEMPEPAENPTVVAQIPTTQPSSPSSHSSTTAAALKAFPLALILQACPSIADYTSTGTISNWRELMNAAHVLRATLGVTDSAYQQATNIMGPENAAVVMACILERHEHINSAGGYLRELTARTARGEFSLGPMLMALIRSTGQSRRKAG